MVYLDGVFQANVTKGVETFTATGLIPAASYTVGTRTVGTNGQINSQLGEQHRMDNPGIL